MMRCWQHPIVRRIAYGVTLSIVVLGGCWYFGAELSSATFWCILGVPPSLGGASHYIPPLSRSARSGRSSSPSSTPGSATQPLLGIELQNKGPVPSNTGVTSVANTSVSASAGAPVLPGYKGRTPTPITIAPVDESLTPMTTYSSSALNPSAKMGITRS